MEYIKGFLEKIGTRCQAGIIGPADETISRINDIYRKVVYVKHPKEEVLTALKNKTEEYIEMMKVTQAKRPFNSQMSKAKLEACGIVVPEWKDGLRRYLEETKNLEI